MELNKNRAEEAKKRLSKVVQGDSLRVSIRSGSISCLFLNPPYDYDEAGRLENRFLSHTSPSLQTDGILVLIISVRSLNRAMVRYLSSWFSDVSVWLFPEKEFQKFSQIVVFGKKRKDAITDDETFKRLAETRDVVEKVSRLTEGCCRYGVPVSVLPEKYFHFRNLEMSPEEMIEEVENDGIEREIFDLVTKRNGNLRVRPAAPLRKGHLAILVASGMTDGLVEKNGKRMLIKGTVRKEKVKTVEKDEDVEIVTETDVLKIEIMGLNLRSGELFSIR